MSNNIQKSPDTIKQDLFRHINYSLPFKAWMGFLTVSLLVCVYAYYIQLRDGLGVTGLRDFVSWGMYISTFVFFVASSLIGMLISAVLGLSGQKWITPITRIAEIIAIAFAAVAGLVIVSDMGRPDRLINVFIHGRFQSPILWDVTVVTTYFVISLLLWYLPLIPDLAMMHGKVKTVPSWQQKIYKLLSIGWADKPEQMEIIKKAMRMLLIAIVPVAFAIHTVTSWLFAVTPRIGWNSTIFGPYFISGAFVAGSACVILAMYFFRVNYKLKDYLQDKHFDMMGKLLVLVSLVYLYFNLNEYLVPAYKMQHHEEILLHALFSGEYAALFWFAQLFGLIIPIVLLLMKRFRKPFPIMLISIFVITGAWLKRYLIVVPVQENPFLPIQHVPEYFSVYKPTGIEILITLGGLILVLMIITMLSKFFPVIPVHETIEENTKHEDTK